MGSARGTALHSKNYKRLPYTFQEKTTAQSTFSSPSNCTLARDVKHHFGNVITRCNTRGQAIPEFHINNFSSAEKRRHDEAYFQPEKPKRVCSHRQIPAYKYPQSARLPSGKRLDGQNRFAPSVFSPTDCTNTPAILTSNVQRKTVRDDLLAIRSKFCSQSLCQSNKLGSPDAAGTRHSHPSLPRRFPPSPSEPFGSTVPCCNHNKFARTPGMDNKQEKVGPSPTKVSGVLGHCMGHMEKYQISPRKNGIQTERLRFEFPAISLGGSETTSDTYRGTKLRQFCRDKRKIKLSKPANACKCSSENTCLHKNSVKLKSKERSPVVANELQSPFSHSLSPTISLSDNRCERHRLGGLARQHELTRHMVRDGTGVTLQPKRTHCHHKRLTRSLSLPELFGFTSPVRQQNHGIVPTQRRRHKISSPSKPCSRSIRNPRSAQHPHDDLSPARQLQLGSGSPVSSEDSFRMAPSANGNRSHFLKMGPTTNRPLCLSTGTCPTGLLHTRQNRPSSQELRCSSSELDLHASLGVPTTPLDPQSTSTPKQSKRRLPDSRSTVGQSILETRSEEQSIRSPVHHQEPTQGTSRCFNRSPATKRDNNDARSLEMWGWEPTLKDWSEEQRSLLASSWRKSTLNTYRPAWKRWMNWTKNNGVNSLQPTGSQFARFLVDLHQVEGLSLSTILVHKSAVSTFCDPDNQTKISSHTLVRQVLKAISLAHPKLPKPPIWDINTLISYLSQKNPETVNFYEASCQTASILLLCSGRRIHDLTLLQISPEHYIQSEDNIILWPAFGSKTDTANRRQSGWKLLQNKENKSLDPVHWVKHLIHLSRPRREVISSHNLFLSTFGDPKPATRSIIAGWMKKTLKDAGIQGTPGSFRSAVASKNWMEQFHLDDILLRGNWKSANTFKKFYCREIRADASKTDLITTLFEPVE